jgi:hypothetical protein
VPITAFDKGKLKIAAHVREELELAGIAFESIQCKSGGMIPPGFARLVVIVDGVPAQLDLPGHDVEECEFIVSGDTWHTIAKLLNGLAQPSQERSSGTGFT